MLTAALLASSMLPRGFEWSYLTSGGYTPRAAVLGAGAEGSVPVLRWRGFPSGYGGHRSELRAGVFAFGATRLGGGLVEGGVLADVTSAYHASWGTFTARLGGGYGMAPSDRPHATVTLLYGVRSALDHHGVPRFDEASVARLFLTHRRSLDAHEWVVGVELSPTFFLPPITWWRLAGGPPR